MSLFNITFGFRRRSTTYTEKEGLELGILSTIKDVTSE
jgi:hypothetical protein